MLSVSRLVAGLALGAAGLFAQPMPLQLGSLNPVPAGPQGIAAAQFTPNLDALRAGLPELSVLLPEGRTIVLLSNSFEDRGNGDVLWKGTVLLEQGSSVLLTLRNGFLVGSIQTQREAYVIVLRGGIQVIERKTRALPNVDAGSAAKASPARSIIPADESTAGGINLINAAVANAGVAVAGDTEIDVMVVYTIAARDSVGGVAQMEASIQGAVDHASAVFVNSEVQAHYRLVHMELVTSLSGLGKTLHDPDMGDSMIALANDVGISLLRNAYGADLVALIVKDANPLGGCAYAMPGNIFAVPSQVVAFQVTGLNCGIDRAYVHENGHLLGMDHDPAHAAPDFHRYAWSYGHQVDGVFSDVMSYGCPTVACPEIPYFSNPNVSYLGYPTGIADQRDNARVARDNGPLVAAFRPAAPSVPPEAPTGLNGVASADQISLVWFPTPNASGYQIDRSTNGTTFTQIGTSPTNNFTDNNVTSPNTYFYRVRATNIRGVSPNSAVKSITMPIPPSAPTGLTATAEGANEIRLNWADTSNNEVGFLVEMLINGVYEPVAGGDGANVTSVIARYSLQPSTTYSFRVFAYSDYFESGRSNVATATTFATNIGVISGYAFNDANKDSIANVGETPAAGLVIFYDLNGNSIYDDGTPSFTVTPAASIYPKTNLPYLSAPNYTLSNLPVGSRRICASFNPAKTDGTFCKVVQIKNVSPGNVNFPVIQGRVGVSSMTPSARTVASGDETIFDVQWTDTDGRWVLLKDAIIRFAASETEDALQVRFEEVTRTFSVSKKGSDEFGPSYAPGENIVLETEDAKFFLRDSQFVGTGPTGPSVTLRLAVAFKPKARGKTFSVLLKLADDNGFVQGFDVLGTVTVTK